MSGVCPSGSIDLFLFVFLSVGEIISTVGSESAATDSLFFCGPESKFQYLNTFSAIEHQGVS